MLTRIAKQKVCGIVWSASAFRTMRRGLFHTPTSKNAESIYKHAANPITTTAAPTHFAPMLLAAPGKLAGRVFVGAGALPPPVPTITTALAVLYAETDAAVGA